MVVFSNERQAMPDHPTMQRSVDRQQSQQTDKTEPATIFDFNTAAAVTEPKHGADFAHRELLDLRAALNDLPNGIVLLDAELRAQFINRAFRRMWRLPDEKADSKPPFVSLMYYGRDTRAYEVPESALDA